MQHAVTVGGGGRIVIPVEAREALGVGVGDVLLLVVEADAVRLLTPAQAVRAAQDLVARHVSPGCDLVGQLLEERRAEDRGR